MNRIVLALLALALAGCSDGPVNDGPAAPQREGLTPLPVVFSSTDLARSTAVGTIVRSTDASGILHLTVPIRAVTDYDITVDYRFTFLDASHALVDQPSSWQTRTLHAGTFEYIQGASPTPRATEFELDVRYAQ